MALQPRKKEMDMKTINTPSRYAAIALALVLLLLVQGTRPFVDRFTVAAFEADEQESVSAAQTWIDESSLQFKRYQHSIAVWNDHIYVFGGAENDSWAFLDSIERATINPDGSLGVWEILSLTLPAHQYQHESIAIGGYVYLMGGTNTSTGQNLVEVFYAEIQADGSLGSWQTTSPMNEPRNRFGVTSANGYLYAMGGQNGSNYLNSVEYAQILADGSLGPWQTTSSLITPRNGLDVVTVNDSIYVLSGFNLSQTYISNTEYVAVQPDGTLGQWQTTASLNIPRGLLAAATNGDSIYVFGGTTGPGHDGVSQSEVAAINTDHTLAPWQYTTSMQPDRAGAAAVWANGYIYVTGGATYGTFLTAVERIYVGGNVDPVITVDQG